MFREIFDWRRDSLVTQMVKNLPAMQEVWVQFLGWEDPLEKEMATHSSILVWEIPWTEDPSGLRSMESQRVRHDWVSSSFTFHLVEEKLIPNLIRGPGPKINPAKVIVNAFSHKEAESVWIFSEIFFSTGICFPVCCNQDKLSPG